MKVPRTHLRTQTRKPRISMPEAARLLSREERFMATIATMNTLLIEKRIYTQQEFDEIFCDWAESASLKRGRK